MGTPPPKAEESLRAVMSGIFQKQKKATLQNLPGLAAAPKKIKAREADIKAIVQAVSPILHGIYKAGGDKALKTVRKFPVAGKKSYEQVQKAAEVEIDFAEWIDDPEVLQALEDEEFLFAQKISETSAEDLRDSLLEGMENGETVDQLKDRIEELYEGWEGYRAERIARTESARAYSKGHVEAWRATGVVKNKVWVAAADACPFCLDMNGTVVELDSNFMDEGETQDVEWGGKEISLSQDYSDVEGPPLHPNCRCALVGELFDDAEMAEQDQAAQDEEEEKSVKGGAGSGNFGHSGRPGEVGGSTGNSNPIESMKHGVGLGKTAGEIQQYIKDKYGVDVTKANIYYYKMKAGKLAAAGASPVASSTLPDAPVEHASWAPDYPSTPQDIVMAGHTAGASQEDIIKEIETYPEWKGVQSGNSTVGEQLAKLNADKANAWVPEDPKNAAAIFKAGLKAGTPPADILAKVKEMFPDSKADMSHYSFYKYKMNKESAAEVAGGPQTPAVGEGTTVPVSNTIAFTNDAPFPASLSGLTVIKALGGTTGAQLVKDEDGNLWVKKSGASAGHIQAEQQADDVYRAAGIAVPPSRLYDGTTKLSAFVEGISLQQYEQSVDSKTAADLHRQIAEGFHMDALLGNRDVIGETRDNILVDKDGRAWRIDNGSSFEFRAQGAVKDYDTNPREFWSMRNPEVNSQSAGVFVQGVSWYATSARLAKMDVEAVAKAIPEGDRRETFLARANTMKTIAENSLDYQHSAYEQGHADRVAEQRVELRASGIQEALPKQLGGMTKYGNPDVMYLDDKGVSGDGMGRSSEELKGLAVATIKYPSGVLELEKAHMTIIAAAKTAGAHAGDQNYNTAKVQALHDAIKTVVSISASHTGPVKEAAAQLYKNAHMVSVAIDTNTKPASMIQPMEKTWQDAGGKPAQISEPKAEVKTGPKTAFDVLISRYKTEGIDYEKAVEWQRQWMDKTNTEKALAFKQAVANQRGGLSEYKWPNGGSKGTEIQKHEKEIGGPAKLMKSMALQAAYTQEFLEHTSLHNSDPKARAIFLVRTESAQVIPTSLKQGKTYTMLRPAASAGSHLKRTSVEGSMAVGQAVPFVDVHSSLLTPNHAAGGTGFCGEGENEWIFTYSNKPVVRMADDEYVKDIGKDASQWNKYNIPTSHLRSLSSKK